MASSFSRDVDLLESRWPMLALMGVASIILGSIAIWASFAATLATVFFLGCLVLAGAVVHLIQSFSTRGWGGVFGHILAAVLYGVAGWYMIVNPTVSAATLTLVIGMLLAVGGLYQTVTSIGMRYRSWGWAFLNGLVTVILGVLIFAQWPVSGLWLIGTFVGIDLMFRGWAALMLAMAVRAGEEAIVEPVRQRRIGRKDRRMVAA